MLTSINKDIKRVLSFLVAFAMIICTLYVSGSGINADALSQTLVWDGTQAETFASGTGSETDPYIIETPEQLAYLALSTSLDSADKYYKVASGLVFDMNGMQGIDKTSTAAEVRSATKNLAYNWQSDSAAFKGNFDGNGLIVYNLYSKQGYNGLFPHVNTDNTAKSITIKNVTVLSSYICGWQYSGGIVGFSIASPGNTLNLDNCAVENCYIGDDGNTGTNTSLNKTSGALIGMTNHNGGTISNCLVKNNDTTATYITGGFVGTSSNYGSAPVFKNCVAIGTLPYSTAAADSIKTIGTKLNQPADYQNVYTDQAVDLTFTGITTITAAEMTGTAAKTNMSALDFDTIWWANEGSIELQVSHSLTLVDNGDGTHTSVCRECATNGIAVPHKYVVENSKSVCACGATINSVELTWNGTQATSFASGTGSESDPYIIETPEQLAYLALSTSLDSADKYYKVADNKVFNMNGMQGIDKTSTAAEVKSATKNTAYNWASDSAAFKGNFDGNGLIVYNLYSKGGYNGLFPKIDTSNSANSITIKNVTVLSSFINGYHYSGGIVGLANGTTSSKLNFDNCAVENCFIGDNGNTNANCNRTSGVLAGSVAHNGGTISNCLAKNNDTTATDIIGGFVGTSSNYGSAPVIKNCVSIGTLPYSANAAGSTRAIGTKMNNPADYQNVYTDQAVDSTFTGITTLTVDEMTGEAAKTNMSALDFSKVWFAVDGGLLELRSSHSIKGVSNGASGHIEACENDCGLVGFEVAHSFTKDKENNKKVCVVCGYSEDIVIGSTDTWNWNSEFNTAPYWGYGDPNLDGSGTEADPYIITTSEQLAAVALWGGDDTAGKYYKVSDDVDTLYLTPNTDSFDNSSFDALKTSLTADKDSKGSAIKKWATNSTYVFQGSFDGNGVTIRGMASTGDAHGGLFPYIKGDVTIKNVTIEDSYVCGKTNVGVISGGLNPNDTNTNLPNITLENCVIKNNYIELQERTSYAKGWGSVGGAIGYVGRVTGSATVNNCYVANNNVVNPGTQKARAFFGGITQNGVAKDGGGYDWPTAISIKNSITDLCPYNTDQYANQVAYFSNIYTTVAKTDDDKVVGDFTDDNIKVVDASDMTGVAARAAMTGLDWGNTWWANESEPELRIFHDITFVYVNETVHISSCIDNGCSAIGVEEPHNFVTAGTRRDCVNCGYSETVGQTADEQYYINLIKRGANDEELYKWNSAGAELPKNYNHVGGYTINGKYEAGEFEEWSSLEGSGTADDPYVIDNSLTLFRIIASGGTDLGVPQHFVITCDIDLATDIRPDGGSSNNTYQWVKLADAKTGTNVIYKYHPFAGIIDGKGHTITGLYTNTDEAAAGFIPQLASGGEIRNLHISGGKAVTTTGSAGLLVGTAEAGSVISGCSVEGGTVAGITGSGMLVGSGSATVKNSYYITSSGSEKYYNELGNAVDASAITADYTGNNADTAVWYKGGAEGATPKLLNRALASELADVDGDGNSSEYTANDLIALKSRLLRKSEFKNVYGDVSRNGKLDIRDLVILQREIINDEIATYDGFWRNAAMGKFSIYYDVSDNYDSARKVQLFMEDTLNSSVNKFIGAGDNSYDIVIAISNSLAEANYSVTYDLDNAVLKITGGSSTAVEEAVDAFVNGSEKSSGKFYTGSGTIPNYKSAINLDSSITSDKYYYVWGDEFDYDDATVANGNHTINYGKWNIRNKSTEEDNSSYSAGYVDIRSASRVEATGINEITADGELKLKRGYDENKKYYVSGIGTQSTMLFKHGYMEIVAEIPDDGFSFPAWWLMTYAGFNNRSMTKSLYGKVYELNNDYNGSIYFDPSDYTSYKYKVPNHTTETDIWEVIQTPGISSSGIFSKSYKLTASTRKTLFVGLHKWYHYSGSRTGDLKLYDIDWDNVKANGGFKTIDTSKFATVSQYGSFSTLADNVSKYNRTYDNSYKTSILNEAAAGITELKYVYGSGAVNNKHLAKRRYGFLWNGSKVVFMAYNGTSADAPLLYQRTVDLADMNYDGQKFVDQYAYMLLENHMFTSAEKNSNGRTLNNYDGNGNAFSGSPFTTDMTVDYVRLYQAKGERDIVTSDTEAFNSNDRWSSPIYK